MKLDTEFCKLPLSFDATRLAEEVNQFSESEWRPHPQGHAGNSALQFISAGGDPTNDAVKGPMAPTPHLDRCPYVKQALAALQTVVGRTRLMRIEGQGEASAHVDTNYYWMQRTRVHIPIVTFADVVFLCGDKQVHMGAGETWIFDTWKRHNVLNPASQARIHLVCDTVGSPPFWEMVAAGERPFGGASSGAASARFIPFEPSKAVTIDTETQNFPVIMTPGEQETLTEWLLEELRKSVGRPAEDAEALELALARFRRAWRSLWDRFGSGSAGWPEYRQAIERLSAELKPFEQRFRLSNNIEFVEMLRQAIIRPAINPDLAAAPVNAASATESIGAAAPPPPAASASLPRARRGERFRFDRPVIVVAAPRSGSTLLFETLARSPSLWTIGGESHQIFEQFPQLRPASREFDSNRLLSADADAATATAVRRAFFEQIRDRDGRRPPAEAVSLRLLEKTPKNALRIPFLNAIFPDAIFVYLFREPRSNISSMIDAWRSGRFVTYPNLPGWTGPRWSLALIQDWRALSGKPLEEIAAQQWKSTNQQIMDDLSALPDDRWRCATYDELASDPQGLVQRIAKAADFAWSERLEGELPLSRHTLTPPNPDKWKKNAELLERVLPGVEAVARRAREMTGAARPSTEGRPIQSEVPPPEAVKIAAAAPADRNRNRVNPRRQPVSSASPADPASSESPFRSEHTTTFPRILEQARISLVISTYQAGRLIVARADQGSLNTHFRMFNKPMGLCVDRARIALGTSREIWAFCNMPAVAPKVEPKGKHDACYLPRNVHVTGDIDIHEMAFSGDDLWFVNTRFSCLCTLDAVHSFVPRWRPPFISALSPEDRCHLNGLGMVNGRPKYVTALGATDNPQGWRENKARGGVLVDVETNETILEGLSMPHSPRWRHDTLWILESGDGSLAKVDLKTGRLETVTRLPGFTRGLDFYGPLAFIGLSQVRETAVFSGLPITERLTERTCGVWIVNIETGQQLGFLRFGGNVQEIFGVGVLERMQFPEVADRDDPLLSHSYVLPDEALADVATPAVPS